MRQRVTAIVSIFILFMILPLTAFAQQPQGNKKSGAVTEQVTGTFTNAAGQGTFNGTLTVNRFAEQSGKLVAIGTLSGTLTDATGKVLGNVADQAVTLPVNRSSIQASCQILKLELGPLDVDLLGLTVHLDPVVLDITAETGSGKLLGNLLCGLAKLLDTPAALIAIVNHLNKILEALG